MKRSNVIAFVVVIVVIVLAAILYAASHKSATSSPSPSPSPSARPSAEASPSTSASPAAAASPGTQAGAVTVEYTGSGFTPGSVTVKSGGKVTFKNSTAQAIQVDSDPHPTHTDNPELNVGTVAPGQSVSVTLSKTGSWGIHNHLDPTMRATIVVQ